MYYHVKKDLWKYVEKIIPEELEFSFKDLIVSDNNCAGGAAVSKTRSFSDAEASLQDRQATTIYDVQAEFTRLKMISLLYCGCA